MKNLLIFTIVTLVMMSSSAYAWNMSNKGGVYTVTCGDGFKGSFDSYPSKGAPDRLCSSHGGVISVDHKPGKAKPETRINDKKR